ncbi:prostaglandin D2 receptor 2 [Pseudorasbora parva]|uniref:prostaglandin D2 receptor 2 n=1 Tax=Pseudorasbora parva TaxID=51549 RepID=UPI00351E3617
MTSSLPPNSSTHCPLLEAMILNTETRVNLAVVAVHGVVSAVGILENGLVLWVLGYHLRNKTVAAVWVLNLAMSDFLTTLTLPLFTYYLLMGHSWELGGPLCAVQASIFFLNMFVSAFLLAVISLDRCLLVSKPVWTQNHRTVSAAWKICGLGWAWAAVNAFPYFMFRSVVEKPDSRKLCYHDFALYSSQSTLLTDCEVRQAVTAVSKVLLAFVMPLVVIAVSYTFFVLELQARRKRLESRRQGARKDKQRSLNFFRSLSSPGGQKGPQLSQGFTKMVVSVIATFILCWLPYHIFCLLEVTGKFVDQAEVGLPLATTFAFLNSVLNPIIYTFSCPNFSTRIRQSVGALFEGLVEESGPLDLVTKRIRKKDLSSPTFLSSPTTPSVVPRIQRDSQGSINLFGFKSRPTKEIAGEQNLTLSCGIILPGTDD